MEETVKDMMVQNIYRILKRDLLLYVVFFTGAVVLAVEVMAVRILAPYFGNTIYTFSSVLSVILAALSLGYWLGGKRADSDPHPESFYRIIVYAGWSVILMQVLCSGILNLFAAFLSLMVGPLVAAVVLFFYPSYLFGLLSPYVIRLRSDALPESGVGTVSGEVFFASTMGSIFGSLLSGFVLVPMVGITTSLLIAGCVTVVVGSVGMLMHSSRWATARRSAAIRLAILITLTLVVVLFAHWQLTRSIAPTFSADVHVRALKDGVYERVAVVDTKFHPDDEKASRVLMLDRTFSSGVTLPEGELLFPYTQYYRLIGPFFDTPNRALILGAGTGTVAKALHETYANLQIDMVDVEPLLFQYASEYFFLPDTALIQGHVADGRQFLRTQESSYDFIFGDMYSQLHAVPWHVSTLEYYRLLHARLSDGGIYVANHIGSLKHEIPSLFWSAVRTLSEVFGEVAVYAVTSPESLDAQNIMIVVRKNAPLTPLNNLALEEDSSLAQLSYHRVAYDAAQLQEHAVYTDDRAPLDLYAARQSARAYTHQ